MTPRDLGPEVRSGLLAARAAKEVYAAAYERLAEQAQLELGAGLTLESRKTRRKAELAMRAYRSEDT